MSLPFEEPEQVVVQRSDFKPADPNDPPSRWTRLIEFLQEKWRGKPRHLAERWAEARVAEKEVDNQVKLLNARRDFELTLAEAAKLRAEAEKSQAEAEKTRAEARSGRADARIREAAARQLEARAKTPEELRERLRSIEQQIAMHGGFTEIEIPSEGPETPDD